MKVPLFNDAFEVISSDAASPSLNLKHTSDFKNLSSESKDLLDRLLEVDPKHRINSLISLKRVAMYKAFNFEKILKREVISYIYFHQYFHLRMFFQISPKNLIRLTKDTRETEKQKIMVTVNNCAYLQ